MIRDMQWKYPERSWNFTLALRIPVYSSRLHAKKIAEWGKLLEIKHL